MGLIQKLKEFPNRLKTHLRDEVVVKRLEQARADIVSNIDTKGIRASGRTGASIEVVVVDENKVVLQQSGAGPHAPYPTLEVGRGAGAVPINLADILLQWSRDKGLTFESEEARVKFAQALKWKIARRGTNRHYKHEDVYSEVVRNTQNEIKELSQAGVFALIRDYFK